MNVVRKDREDKWQAWMEEWGVEGLGESCLEEGSRTRFNTIDKKSMDKQWLVEQGPRGERKD